MKLNKELRSVLITFLQDKVKVASWGISNIIINPDSLTFDVDAMNYKGTISLVVSSNGKYIINIGEESYSNCSLRNIVDDIDRKIESSPDYLNDLEEWIEQRRI